ncbi:hypothetical protein LOTGIDRAFT_168230 [Lottia gigantea]|uniref:Tyrosine specific protein phosphatases domain-containing protein n=1 Tax=Lottia gigantea TaxID=225164 RepID=V3ZL18_LOTGI|nr:hypothetical protein LOTGIDRAFT_168230 [Lottia gigantea]ESO84972.1 hypothetical protein LOTGIDRAFT_168230 [Lottia gigantea]
MSWITALICLSVVLFIAIITLVIVLKCCKPEGSIGRRVFLHNKKKRRSESMGNTNPTYISDAENDQRDYENVPNKRLSQLKNGVSKCLEVENKEVAKAKDENKKQNHAVKVEELNQHLRKLHKNSNRLLKEELKNLQAASPTLPMTVAQKIENRKKNLNDVNRVKLIRGDEPIKKMNDYVNISCTDYINASYIAFHQYWNDLNTIKKVDKLTIELKKIITQKNFTSNIFELTKGSKHRSLRHYHLPGWKDGCPTLSPKDVIDFLEDVYSNVPETLAEGKIVFHSRTGNGRCGVMIGVDICRRTIRDNELSDEIDIYEIVLKMLNARTQIITLEKLKQWFRETILMISSIMFDINLIWTRL